MQSKGEAITQVKKHLAVSKVQLQLMQKTRLCEEKKWELAQQEYRAYWSGDAVVNPASELRFEIARLTYESTIGHLDLQIAQIAEQVRQMEEGLKQLESGIVTPQAAGVMM